MAGISGEVRSDGLVLAVPGAITRHDSKRDAVTLPAEKQENGMFAYCPCL